MNRGIFNDRTSNATGQAVAQDADTRGVLDGTILYIKIQYHTI